MALLFHALLTAAVAGVAGCKGSAMQSIGDSGKEQRSVTAESAGCKLDVEVLEVNADHLTLRYSFLNGTDRSAYLFNRLHLWPNPQGAYQTDKNRVYVVTEHGAVTLSKKIIPVPGDIAVESPNVPCATLVKPGATAGETVTLSLPLVPYTPYLRGATPPPDAALHSLKAWFELGLFLVPPEGDRLARLVETTEGPAYTFGSVQASRQTILRAGPLPTTVPVRLLK